MDEQTGPIAFKDKFVAYVDILGFKDIVSQVEAGTGRPPADLGAILDELARPRSRASLQKYGPITCPNSARIQQDLDFEATQVSDCAIVSAEISPAGVINLVAHCWQIALMLLTKGVLVRGYITRGRVNHRGYQILGTGYQNAYAREAGVTAFRQEADERGTPFIEIDPAVCAYVQEETDPCVREMFGRKTKGDGEAVAIFPFQVLGHSFVIAGGGHIFDPEVEKRGNDSMRRWITEFRANVLRHADPDNTRAMSKVRTMWPPSISSLRIATKRMRASTCWPVRSGASARQSTEEHCPKCSTGSARQALARKSTVESAMHFRVKSGEGGGRCLARHP